MGSAVVVAGGATPTTLSKLAVPVAGGGGGPPACWCCSILIVLLRFLGKSRVVMKKKVVEERRERSPNKIERRHENETRAVTNAAARLFKLRSSVDLLVLQVARGNFGCHDIELACRDMRQRNQSWPVDVQSAIRHNSAD